MKPGPFIFCRKNINGQSVAWFLGMRQIEGSNGQTGCCIPNKCPIEGRYRTNKEKNPEEVSDRRTLTIKQS